MTTDPGTLVHQMSSCTIMACRDTLVAGLAIRTTAWCPDVASNHVDKVGMPVDIKVSVMTALPRVVVPLRATTMEGLHQDAIARAWRDGSWDLAVTLLPPLERPSLGLVDADCDYSADPGLSDILTEAARLGRLATWLWLPLRGGPTCRVAAHGSRDTSLDAEFGRAGSPTKLMPSLDWDRCEPRQWIIRLGTPVARPATRQIPSRPLRRRRRPATERQIAFIGALRQRMGVIGQISEELSLTQASAIIDRLLQQGGRRGGGDR